MIGSNGLGIDFFYSVYFDSCGRIWFGIDGYGISCFYLNGYFIKFEESSEGILLCLVYGIVEDVLGWIWISVDE